MPAADRWSAQTWPRLAALEQGELEEVPVAPLLCALADAGATAVVDFERRQVRKSVVLEHGAPVDCRSNLVHETLGRFLVAQGKLDAEALGGCLSEAAARDLPLGEILLGRGTLQPVELYRLLQQNLAKKLLDLFTWTDGRFRVSRDVPVVRSALRVKVHQLVLTGLVRFAPQAQIDAAIAALVGERLQLHPAPRFDLGELRLTGVQPRVLTALAAGGRLDELAAAAGAPAEELSRFVLALVALGAALPASVASRLVQAPAGAAAGEVRAAAAPPATAPAAAPAGAPAGALAAALVEALNNDVMQAFLRYRQQDAFDFFGLPEEASPAAIEARYLELAERWSPARFAAAELEPLAERARDLFLAAARSYAELAASEQRSALLFRRKTLREQGARRPAQHGIRTDLLDPEVQFRKGQEHLEAGHLREAAQQFQFAADCDPQNGLYLAELAWTRHRLTPGLAERTLRELEEALRVDPQCGLASYYAGLICGELGRPEQAENHLRAASRRLAPDRRPIEALKALATKKKR
jgi:hypothetical protein